MESSTTEMPRAAGDRISAEPTSTGKPQEMLIDTSRMSEGQRSALETAEQARDQHSHRDSFAAQLLFGRFDPKDIMAFPQQNAADRAAGDALTAKVSAFLAEHLDPDEVDATRTIPVEVISGLRELGVFRMKVPIEYGGLGLSQVNYNRVIQSIASYCGSTAVLVSAHQSIGVPQPLKMFGTEAQKAKYLPLISKGALSAFALTEPGVGSDPARMTTNAVPTADGKYYILNGEKLWTTNGPIADLLVVMAQTPPKIYRGRERKQITAFIVEADAPGVEVVHRCDFLGLRAIQNGVMRFTNVRVPAENILLGEGQGLKLALRTLNTGRLTLPAACAAIGKQCLGIARVWGAERVQWGRAIGEHEAGRTKIAYIAATTFAMEAVTWLTSHWADEQRDIRIEAGMAKLFCSEASWHVIDQTLQLRGGRGYERADSLRERGESPYPLERYLRDGRINTIIEGTSDIMRLFLAREALDPHLSLAGDLLKPGAPIGAKIRCAGRMTRHYSGWYPMRFIGRAIPARHREAGPLARHLRYIDRSSNRLAMSLFHAMAMNGPKLEQRQELLGRLMDIGTELFAMTATCGFALSKHRACFFTSTVEASREKTAEAPRRGGNLLHSESDSRTSNAISASPRLRGESAPGGNSIDLADLFCRQARKRIAEHFRGLRSRDWRRVNRLSKCVLEGNFTWLERGITPCLAGEPFRAMKNRGGAETRRLKNKKATGNRELAIDCRFPAPDCHTSSPDSAPPRLRGASPRVRG